jgi:hypothetical protein
VHVEGCTSHCRSLKRQRAQRAPFTNFRSELSAQSQPLRTPRRKTTALLLFRTPVKPRPVRKKTRAAAPAALGKPRAPKRPPGQKSTSAPRRHSAGGWCLVSGVPRKRRSALLVTWPYIQCCQLGACAWCCVLLARAPVCSSFSCQLPGAAGTDTHTHTAAGDDDGGRT